LWTHRGLDIEPALEFLGENPQDVMLLIEVVLEDLQCSRFILLLPWYSHHMEDTYCERAFAAALVAPDGL
jgi:hypothetical protein